jgi:class 3 adenylate cyclase/tetratricopeptide (TPR) repeat protein
MIAVCAQCGRDNAHDARFCSSCGAELALEAGASGAVRKAVTVLFSDITDSTPLGEQLDPESLRSLMTRWHQAVRVVLERHGGTVEKFVGDAVMAVFGVPVAHEDDALRAVRAASEMRAELARLNSHFERDHGVSIESRTGINTGEVVTSVGETLVTGDAVNVAARLERLAEPGHVLLGESTYGLVRDVVDAEAVGPLLVKGKTERIRAWRLLSVVADAATAFITRLETPFVGRELELDALDRALTRATERHGCELVTVIGEPGVGKSRLVREFSAAAAERARFAVGRCVPYGEGITYWPLGEIVKHLAGGDGTSLRHIVGDEMAADRIAGAVGFGKPTGSSEEIQWAARKLVEAVAVEQPVVLVLDDIHWAEPAFLDLIEYLAGFARDGAILLLCLARPELLEVRPSWTAPRSNGSMLFLERLTHHEAGSLVEALGAHLTAAEREQVLDAAEGNPLFVEQLLAFLAERGGEGNGLPPSLHALLTARIDRLEPAQRVIIECAAVEGRSFHHGAVAELVPADLRPVVAQNLLALVRKGLLRPDRSDFVGDDGFRFAHILIREAAYATILKRRRAELHRRLADWLEQQGKERIDEFEEVLGYHFEQAFLYSTQLSQADEQVHAVGMRAARHLGRAGQRALGRGDAAAATGLLQRASAVLADSDPARPELLASLALARTATGELESAHRALVEATARADELGDGRTSKRAAVERARIELLTGAIGPDEARERAEDAISTLSSLDDDLGLAKAWLLLVFVYNWRLEYSPLDEAAERARFHAQRAEAARDAADALLWIGPAAILGPRPVPAAIEYVSQIGAEMPGPLGEAAALMTVGCLQVMANEADAGRELYRRSEAIYRDLGMRLIASGQATLTGWVELVAGDPTTAESLLRAAYLELEEMGERGLLAGAAAELARVLCIDGRYDEAERLAAVSEELSGPRGVFNTILIAGVRARVLAARGDLRGAIHAAEDAVARAAVGDCLELRADAYGALSHVMNIAGRMDEATEALRHALAVYERKRNIVAAERTRAALSQLDLPVP